MYRKTLVDPAAAAVPGLRPRGCRSIRGTNPRPAGGRAGDCLQRMLPVFLLSAVLLHAAPDPDIFDGRVTPQQSSGDDPAATVGDGASAATGGGQSGDHASASSSAQSPVSGRGASSRDFSQVGQSSSGQQVASSGSGASGGAADASPAGTDAAAGGATATPADSGGGAAGAEPPPRDFSEIGGLTGAAGQGVEVNTSKAAPPPGGAAGHSPGKAPTAPPDPGQGTGGSGSQPAAGNQSGDYGQTLPSGI